MVMYGPGKGKKQTLLGGGANSLTAGVEVLQKQQAKGEPGTIWPANATRGL